MEERVKQCAEMIDELNRRGGEAEKAAVNIFAEGLRIGMNLGAKIAPKEREEETPEEETESA